MPNLIVVVTLAKKMAVVEVEMLLPLIETFLATSFLLAGTGLRLILDLAIRLVG